MAYKKYSDNQITESVIRLAVNKYDYELTSEQLGIPSRTLRRWDKDVTKKGVPELLERAIERMLTAIPANWSGHDWAIALGILMDKWLLLQGEPTTRTENIFTALQEIPEDELDALIREFEEAAKAVVASKNGKDTA